MLYYIHDQSFRHWGLRRFETGAPRDSGQPRQALGDWQLAALDTAQNDRDMDVPGFRLHPLKGELRGRWSIVVNGNWRVTFRV